MSSVFQPIENHLKQYAEINNNSASHKQQQVRTSISDEIENLKDLLTDSANVSATSTASRASPPLTGIFSHFVLYVAQRRIL